jgi:hypothetical protein
MTYDTHKRHKDERLPNDTEHKCRHCTRLQTLDTLRVEAVCWMWRPFGHDRDGTGSRRIYAETLRCQSSTAQVIADATVRVHLGHAALTFFQRESWFQATFNSRQGYKCKPRAEKLKNKSASEEWLHTPSYVHATLWKSGIVTCVV